MLTALGRPVHLSSPPNLLVPWFSQLWNVTETYQVMWDGFVTYCPSLGPVLTLPACEFIILLGIILETGGGKFLSVGHSSFS